MTILIDLNFVFASLFGAGVRNKRSLSQEAVEENYKKAMIGDILYRQFVIAHTVLDYEDAIFTDNLKAIEIKHLIKVLADGSEYHRFYTGELELEKDAVLLPEDQQPKLECPPCAVCACVQCEACAECELAQPVPNDRKLKAPRNKSKQRGSKYLKNSIKISPKMAPIDC